MSATNRSDVRQPDDNYATPAWAVRAILPHLQRGTVRDVLDPCAGSGAILKAARGFYLAGPEAPVVRGIEIHEGRRDHVARELSFPCERADALAMPLGSWGKPQIIVENPPFSLAIEFVTRSLAEMPDDGDCAVLLRLAFLESQARAAFHREHPADLFVLESRPEFVASLKCIEPKAPDGTVRLKKGCGWHDTFPIDEPRPTKCRECRGRVSVTTTDASAYAWFVYGKGRGNRWWILDADRSA